MKNRNNCNKNYYSEDSPNFLVEYGSGFEEDMDKVDYACGDVITERIGIVSIAYDNLEKLLTEVKSIIFLEPSGTYVLQDISPNEVDEIYSIKGNP